MKPLRASQMPQIKRQMGQLMGKELRRYEFICQVIADNPHVDLSRLGRGATAEGVRATRAGREIQLGHLLEAPMWWLDADMTSLVADTARAGDLPELELPPCGVMWLSGGVEFDIYGRPLRAEALSWSTLVTARGAEVTLPAAWYRDGDGRMTQPEMSDFSVDYWNELFEDFNTAMLRILTAALLLAKEPSVAVERPATFDRDGDPRDPRRKPISGVTVIAVRPRPNPETGPDGEPLPPGREFTHRWIVRGHMHTVRYGRGKALSRRQWYPPYVAGPEGLPLVVKDRVWALRGDPKPAPSSGDPAA